MKQKIMKNAENYETKKRIIYFNNTKTNIY